MYRLTDIAISNWYLIRREQIRIRGAAALVGPTGAGKSTIFDAVGTVLAGNNASRLALNASQSAPGSLGVPLAGFFDGTKRFPMLFR